MKIYDLTYPYETGMPVFPGDIQTEISQLTSVEKEGYCTYKIQGANHCGTHMDSPAHMLSGGLRIGDLPLHHCIGKGQIIDCRGNIDTMGHIHFDATFVQDVEEQDILFFHTGWGKHYGSQAYYQEHPTLGSEWVAFFQKMKIKLIGMDMPSPDYYPFPFHHALFEAGIYMIENLANMDQIEHLSHKATFMAIPLFANLDGSWVRVCIQD